MARPNLDGLAPDVDREEAERLLTELEEALVEEADAASRATAAEGDLEDLGVDNPRGRIGGSYA